MNGDMSALHIVSSPEKTLVQIKGEEHFNALVYASEIYTLSRIKWMTSISLTLMCVSFALGLSLIGGDDRLALRTLCTMLVTYSMTSLWFLGKYRKLYQRARAVWMEREKVEPFEP